MIVGRNLGAAVVLACLVTLAACSPSTEPSVVPAPEIDALMVPPAAVPAPLKPARKPIQPAPTAAPGALSSPLVPPRSPDTTPTTAFERLIGLDQPGTVEVLGEPRQRAESPPATIWRYVGEDCELDVYFYLDLQNRMMRALHYEVRSHDPIERPAQRCYDQLVTERGARVQPASGTDRPR